MGVDIPDIWHVIQIGPPCSLMPTFQETGCAGSDGNLSSDVLYNKNQIIGKNRVGMQDDMTEFCVSKNLRLRRLPLKSYFNLDVDNSIGQLLLCCNVCEEQCKCSMCLHP